MLPRMRTAAGVLAIIKEEDPNTKVSLHYLRCLIASGKIPVTCAGKKRLVDADAVIAYIAKGENEIQDIQSVGAGKIRRVPV